MTALITSSKCAPGAAIFPVRFGRPNAILVREETRRDGLNSSVGYSVTARGEFSPAPFASPKRAGAATIFPVRLRRPNPILLQAGAPRDGLNSSVGYSVRAPGEFIPAAFVSSERARAATTFRVRFRRPNPALVDEGTRHDRLHSWVGHGVTAQLGSMTLRELISAAGRLCKPNPSFAEQKARRDDLRGRVEDAQSAEATVR